MKKLKKDFRFWLVIIATGVFLYSTEKLKTVPPQDRAVAEAGTLGLSFEGIFAGIIFIGFATLLVLVHQHYKTNKD